MLAPVFPWPEGYRLCALKTTCSTHEEAFERYRLGERGPLWIVAQEQTAGRGRHGRSWISPPGNLYATLMLEVPVPLSKALELSFVCALAMRETVQTFLQNGDEDGAVLLKWPNDILVKDRKISGILLETLEVFGQERTALALGFGLNLSSAPTDVRTPSTCLSALGAQGVPAFGALACLATCVARTLEAWSLGQHFPAIVTEWTRHAWRLGEPLSLKTGQEEIEGTFLGLSQDGALLMRLDNGQIRVFHAGDIEGHLSPCDET